MSEINDNKFFNDLNDLINKNYKPDFIYNNGYDKKVIDRLIENLNNCDEFFFSVAFITQSGIVKLLNTFKELEERGIKGKIITTDYLYFSEPKALNDILKFKNIELRMFEVNNPDLTNVSGFHTKGYIFRNGNNYKAIIGSSNITAPALTNSIEWNTEISTPKVSNVIQNILEQFENNWRLSINYLDIKDKYEKEFNTSIFERNNIKNNLYKDTAKIKPNAMQEDVCKNLEGLIKSHAKRGLLISSTGTGKTFASAFAVDRALTLLNVHKVLYVTHRETILKKSIDSYKRVLGDKCRAQILSGNNHYIDPETNLVFATLDTIREEKYLFSFKKDEFDFIIIDEAHRIGDNTYQKVINYFDKTKFLFGMTATPDRTDGYDIYNLFNHNIIYELRLPEALETHLISSFNYFGICDISVNGETLDDNSDFNRLVADERVNNIIEKMEFYGYSGSRLKGLVFCRSILEGKELCSKFNLKGYKCEFIDGSTAINYRDEVINKLEEEDLHKPFLDLVFTVDVFNEGVDIPSINTVIFLRPTQSPIIFLQQLGRGLRLVDGKDYLTVLDFIGNYSNNYLIPLTFIGKADSKEVIVKRTLKPLIYGESSISFDKISRKRIYESIDQSSLTDYRKKQYQYKLTKNKLGRIPTLIEYEQEMYPARAFLDYAPYQNYYEFLCKNEDDFKIRFSSEEAEFIDYISRYFGSGNRIYEPLLVKFLLEGKNEKDFANDLKDRYDLDFYAEDIRRTTILLLTNKFVSDKKINNIIIKEVNKEIVLDDKFKKLLLNKNFYDFITMILEYSIYSFENNFAKFYDKVYNFVPFKYYTLRDISKILNLAKSGESTMFGYAFYKNDTIFPIIVTLQKGSKDFNYDDYFIDQNTFAWCSKFNRPIDSTETARILNLNKNGRVFLFVKKSESVTDNSEKFFYCFAGEIERIELVNEKQQYRLDAKNRSQPVTHYKLHLKNRVEDEIFNYFTISDDSK